MCFFCFRQIIVHKNLQKIKLHGKSCKWFENINNKKIWHTAERHRKFKLGSNIVHMIGSMDGCSEAYIPSRGDPIFAGR